MPQVEALGQVSGLLLEEGEGLVDGVSSVG